MSLPIGAQLYTVREDANRDYAGTLESLAGIGFTGIEFFGGQVLPAVELRLRLDGLGMASIGYHVMIDELQHRLDEVLEYNSIIGSRYIVCPYCKFTGREGYIQTAAFFNQVGLECKKTGIQFCYHHHGHEFELIDGEYGLDILFGHSSPDLVQAELDVYYVQSCGLDPVSYMKKYSGRCPLLHLRDINGDAGKTAAEMGKGILNMKPIIDKSSRCGVHWLIAEEDCQSLPAMESMRRSFRHLSAIQDNLKN